MPYRICTRCVMDTSDPEIQFDARGVCNHCYKFDHICAHHWIQDPWERVRQRDALIQRIQAACAQRAYDCVVGVSGGLDSTYVAYQAKKLGLRPLAVHFDSGWNSELAVDNISKLLRRLEIDLYTYVVDWEEMRDLQLSFFKSGVANCDIPTDHAITATLYRVAKERGIRFILTGQNHATETILPSAWGYNAQDLRHLHSIQRRFGTKKLKNYPTLSFFELYVYYPRIRRIELVTLLNYIEYQKNAAKEELARECGWRDYGGKHFESIFTRFFQNYYLPKKFGIDKRRAHLASLVVSGQMSRSDALEELERPPCSEQQLEEDKAFVAKKLGLTVGEFDKILSLPRKDFRDYPSNEKLFRWKTQLGAWKRAWHRSLASGWAK